MTVLLFLVWYTFKAPIAQKFNMLLLSEKEWKNPTKVLPEVDFPFHEDKPNVKEMTEEPVGNGKKAYLKANIDHGY